MYIPKAFREDDLETLHTLIQDYSFATLVTVQEGVPVASHIPFILDTQRGPYGTLRAHLARGNQQWRYLDGQQEVLVIFQGPHAYVSPSWYEVELSVPTWNYAVVHAYGVPHLIEEPGELYALLQTLVEENEAGFERPWKIHAPDDEYMQKMMHGVVGFEIEIDRLEGKFKLNQNRSVSDQERVVAMLKNSADAPGVGVAKLMEQRL